MLPLETMSVKQLRHRLAPSECIASSRHPINDVFCWGKGTLWLSMYSFSIFVASSYEKGDACVGSCKGGRLQQRKTVSALWVEDVIQPRQRADPALGVLRDSLLRVEGRASEQLVNCVDLCRGYLRKAAEFGLT